MDPCSISMLTAPCCKAVALNHSSTVRSSCFMYSNQYSVFGKS